MAAQRLITRILQREKGKERVTKGQLHFSLWVVCKATCTRRDISAGALITESNNALCGQGFKAVMTIDRGGHGVDEGKPFVGGKFDSKSGEANRKVADNGGVEVNLMVDGQQDP